tara:strand:+ start:3885 stop:4151 length:267 start_codon:yes stop_codon:yes gene_type:complete
VHRFDWRKKHAQVINESTSHLFFSFQKRISSRIPSTTDGGIAKKSRRSRRGVVRARATRIRKKKNAGEENDDDDAREDKEEHEYYKYY